MRLNPLLIAGLLLAAAAIHASDKADGAIDSTAAFARLKTLVGEWEANTSMGKARVTYELIAGGSSLVERESAERMPAMMTVYYMDGNRLLLTHYCMAGNQPRMQAQGFDPKTGEVQFRFLDATNMTRHDAIHMHNATFRMVDKDHFTSDWELYENGQRKTTESFQYARVR